MKEKPMKLKIKQLRTLINEELAHNARPVLKAIEDMNQLLQMQGLVDLSDPVVTNFISAADELYDAIETRMSGNEPRASGPKLPVTARDWQLFSDMEGVEEAAGELTAALTRAGSEVKTALDDERVKRDQLPKILYKAYAKHMDPVMKKHQDLGAWDTEPRGVAKGYLEAIAHEAGFYGYINF